MQCTLFCTQGACGLICAKKEAVQEDSSVLHCIPSSTALPIFFSQLHFLLMQLLFFLLVLFQDFLHDFLCHKPILHFRFGLAVLCIGAFLSFQKHCILCVQLADARELFVRTVLFLIGIKSRAAQKSRRCTPCGMISCFIRLFSLAILVPRVLLACFLRSKTDHFRGPRTAPKALNFPANRRRETYREVGKISAWRTAERDELL